MARYIEILFPLALELLTYEDGVGDLRAGEFIATQMGSSETARYYTGVVWRTDVEKPDYKRIREVTKRVNQGATLSEKQRSIWEWVARYYLSTLGEVMSAALPSMIRPRGDNEQDITEFTPAKEYYIAINSTDRSNKIIAAILDIDKGSYTRYNEIPRRLIDCDLAKLRTLERKGLITITQRERNIESVGNIAFSLPPLTPHQQEALSTITDGLNDKSCALLHGVTGSGKTEVYIHLIAKELSKGKDVLLLLPEIALTTQLIERMEKIFGSRVTPYHSGLTPKRRTEIFLSMCQGNQGGRFIVGARSAIFLPLNYLGLIVVDEEHDSSYKQSDPSPRYNARDLSHIVAAQSGAKVVLGSATPSLESWTNAMSGKFTMARLTERYGGAKLPKIVISDTRRAAKRGERRGHFNYDLYSRIEQRLERGEQIMLFQNRRGFAPYVECKECGWIARCPNCNISLTMHKSNRELTCHYCNYSEPLPNRCPSCHVGELSPMGFGTEKIEEQIAQFFPTARVLRLDRDTSTSMRKFEQIIGSFARHESDILIGTQMITKGFDFPDVTLVGILNADNTLQVPDFRAEERAYSLLTQVAGRAGRREGAEAEVVVQTTQPTHRVLQYVKDADYEGLATTLLEEREAFSYPPYSRLLTMTLKHKCNQRLSRATWRVSHLLRERFGRRVRGPITPPVDRVMGEWILGFTIRIEAGASSMRARDVMREVVEQWRVGSTEQEGVENRSIKLTFDVDPQ